MSVLFIIPLGLQGSLPVSGEVSQKQSWKQGFSNMRLMERRLSGETHKRGREENRKGQSKKVLRKSLDVACLDRGWALGYNSRTAGLAPGGEEARGCILVSGSHWLWDGRG